MELFTAFLLGCWELSLAGAPYILGGVIAAGFLHLWLPEDFISRHLGSDDAKGVAKAALFGMPLPVCSCSVIPLAAALKKRGAGNGPVLAFLISTPITGADSIVATYGVLGGVFTLFRLLSSLVIALAAGLAANLWATDAPPAEPAPEKESCGCCSCHAPEPKKEPAPILKALDYAFNDLFKDIAKPLAVGILLGGAVTALLPESMKELAGEAPWLGYMAALAVSLPLYVCATASIPLAASMVLAGFTPGAAFVLLTAGPATNTVTLSVVAKMLGKKALALYLAAIILGSLLFGIALDLLFDRLAIDASALVHMNEEPGLFSVAANLVMIGLIFRYLFLPVFKKR